MKKLSESAAEQLKRRKQELLGLYRQNATADEEIRSTVEPDWPDRASEEEASTVLRSLSERERQELEEIDAALERIKSGKYGECVVCGGPIGKGRLNALPHAATCVECSDSRPTAPAR